jgi:uncharacterized membrane protein
MIYAAILNGWLHLLAAVVWIGGAYFSSQILAPAAGELPPAEAGKLNRAVAGRATPTIWAAILLVVVTGMVRMAGLGFFNPDILIGTPYGNVLSIKLFLVAVMVFIGALTTWTGADLARMAADSPPPVDKIRAARGRINNFLRAIVGLGAIVILLSVALRVMGFPEV